MRFYLNVVCAFLFVASSTGQVSAQTLLYSFETGLEGWAPTGQADSDYVSHAQFTGNATNGTKSMQVITGTGFGRDVQIDVPAGPVFDALQAATADLDVFTLDFDVSFDATSWTGLVNGGTYAEFNIFANSTTGGFREAFGTGNRAPYSVPGTIKLSVPVATLFAAGPQDFYQFGIGTNSDPLGTGSFKYYVDNIRLTEIPTFVEDTLFSWETPDNPGTPAVNEQFEGWADGFSGAPYFHTRTITTEGATDGSSAISFRSPAAGFSWGSQFQIDSGENGNPANQPRIDQLIDQINGADRIAFDVTFPADQFPDNPSFLSLFLNISDQSGTFYQSSPIQAGNPSGLAGQTVTLEAPLSSFTAGALNLATNDLVDGTYFRMALATNSNSPVTFIIDNIRTLSLESTGTPGDFDEDGDVDGRDFLAWQRGESPNPFTAGDLAEWQNAYVNGGLGAVGSLASVPEPNSLLILAIGLMLVHGKRTR